MAENGKFIKISIVQLNNAKEDMYLYSDWEASKIKFLAQRVNSDKCFEGEVDKEEVHQAANDLGICPSVFYLECKLAFTDPKDVSLVFHFDLERNTLELVKQLENVQAVYMSIHLREASNKTAMLSVALEQIQNKDLIYSKKIDALTSSLEESLMQKQALCDTFKKVFALKKDSLHFSKEDLEAIRTVANSKDAHIAIDNIIK